MGDCAKIPLVFILLISLIDLSCQDGKNSEIPKYDSSEFQKLVPTQNHLVIFVSSLDKTSLKILTSPKKSQVWSDLKARFDKKNHPVQIAQVDCSSEALSLCTEQHVTKYPSVVFYKYSDDEGEHYKGSIILEELEKFIEGKLKAGDKYGKDSRNSILELTKDNYKSEIASGHIFINFCTPWSSRCIDMESVWKEIGEDLLGEHAGFKMGIVDCSLNREICDENKIRKNYPSLFWFTNGSFVGKYESKQRDSKSIKKFIYKKLGKNDSGGNMGEKESLVVKLDKKNWAKVTEEVSLVFIMCLTPWSGPSQKLMPIWEDLAEFFKNRQDKIRIGTLDCKQSRDICDEEGVSEFPTLILFKDGNSEGAYKGSTKLSELKTFLTNSIGIQKDEL